MKRFVAVVTLACLITQVELYEYVEITEGLVNGMNCSPPTEWTSICNDPCSCDPYAKLYCHRRSTWNNCIVEERCVPRTSWMIGCRHCFCHDVGLPICENRCY